MSIANSDFVRNKGQTRVYTVMMGKLEFVQWIREQRDGRGWGVNELSRRAELSNSYVSNVLNGVQMPGRKFYGGMARAFGVPKVDLLRRAGELPPKPGNTERLFLRELWQILSQMNDRELGEIRNYARFVASNGKHAAGNRPSETGATDKTPDDLVTEN